MHRNLAENLRQCQSWEKSFAALIPGDCWFCQLLDDACCSRVHRIAFTSDGQEAVRECRSKTKAQDREWNFRYWDAKNGHAVVLVAVRVVLAAAAGVAWQAGIDRRRVPHWGSVGRGCRGRGQTGQGIDRFVEGQILELVLACDGCGSHRGALVQHVALFVIVDVVVLEVFTSLGKQN